MADKALLIGINNYQSVGDLRGCVNDVENMRKLLTSVLDFPATSIKTLLNEEATRTRINQQMKWLFSGVKKGDRVLLHFSGHGSSIQDQDGDEDGGADELLCLYEMNFSDPNSYLRDDDLRQWTRGLPEGARLLVVLDCCHSGTGTRMMLAPNQRGMQAVVKQATAERILRGQAGRRALGVGGEAAATTLAEAILEPEEEQLVLARFVPPPAGQAPTHPRTTRRLLRALPQSDMNHVLLAACRDNQTAADAHIGGSFNGAFTYYLCQTLEERGSATTLKDLHQRVAHALRAGHFEQVPQLEGAKTGGVLFEGHARPGVTPSDDEGEHAHQEEALSSHNGQRPLDLLSRIVGTGAGLTTEDRQRALNLLERLVGPTGAPTGPGRRTTGGRHLVYVHGITEHVAGYSNGWFAALRPFTEKFGDGTLNDTRHEVLWSNLVNERALAGGSRGDRDTQERLVAEIREVLQDRLDRHTLEAAPRGPRAAPRALGDVRGRGIPGLTGIDDFALYLLNDTVRAAIIGRFLQEVQPLLQAGADVDVISHSWGTVVAYEGLCELEDAGFTTEQVRNFFTVGAALSIGPVKSRLRPANRDGRRPAPVRRWVNLDARGDIVGGPLQGRPYDVDEDHVGLEPFGCASGLFGLVNPSCAHGSYFKQGNDPVNRDLFARFIES